jgi:hypothetical protein
MKTTFLISALLCCLGLVSAAEAPSKSAKSKSLKTAHAEAEKITKLSYEGVYRVYRCELFFYGSLADRHNFGGLEKADRAELQPRLDSSSFFLHRFTPKDEKKSGFEIFVSENGTKILWKRHRPNTAAVRIGADFLSE